MDGEVQEGKEQNGDLAEGDRGGEERAWMTASLLLSVPGPGDRGAGH